MLMETGFYDRKHMERLLNNRRQSSERIFRHYEDEGYLRRERGGVVSLISPGKHRRIDFNLNSGVLLKGRENLVDVKVIEKDGSHRLSSEYVLKIDDSKYAVEILEDKTPYLTVTGEVNVVL